MDTIIVLIDGLWGQNIPQRFAELHADAFTYAGAHAAYLADIEILRDGHDHEFYWEAWDAVLMKASVRADLDPPSPHAGWTLDQDGDVFLVHPDHEWSDA